MSQVESSARGVRNIRKGISRPEMSHIPKAGPRPLRRGLDQKQLSLDCCSPPNLAFWFPEKNKRVHPLKIISVYGFIKDISKNLSI
ncbi:hypothetical protein CEXT_741041 [Caerostris extrusa]|uniref:Uncharacterized protein n=1 Tax=Caerostris extrusa TaxID=172846 RepID=A0AAV4Q8W2_CAEEX|nr:hypothetical protein CEXT_741041 [Caerostris extrusa]